MQSAHSIVTALYIIILQCAWEWQILLDWQYFCFYPMLDTVVITLKCNIIDRRYCVLFINYDLTKPIFSPQIADNMSFICIIISPSIFETLLYHSRYLYLFARAYRIQRSYKTYSWHAINHWKMRENGFYKKYFHVYVTKLFIENRNSSTYQ